MNKKQILLFLFLLGLDQGAKYLAVFYLENESLTIIPNFFELYLAYNKGAAWSIFQNQIVFFLIIGIIALYYLRKLENDFKKNSLRLIVFTSLYAGIIGNMIDRLFLGYVRDFLKFTIFGYHFPIFNPADIFIVLGGICLIWYCIRGDENEKIRSREYRKTKN